MLPCMPIDSPGLLPAEVPSQRRPRGLDGSPPAIVGEFSSWVHGGSMNLF